MSQSSVLNAVQERVKSELLCLQAERPSTSDGLVVELQRILSDIAGPAVATWHEPTFFMGKAGFSTIKKCEGLLLANNSGGKRGTLPMATAVGIVTHRAIQMNYTNPGHTPAELVRKSIEGSLEEEAFSEMMLSASDWDKSELISQSTNKLVSFLDTFPPLEESWVPRFELSFSTRLGGLTLAGRPDLTLGRPRDDGKQTMFLCDFKTGALRDEHILEARFYALVATLRNGVAPYRSCVFSLSSGQWCDPEVTYDTLIETAHDVASAIAQQIEVVSGSREPVLNSGKHCTWCPSAESCPESGVASPDFSAVSQSAEIGKAFTASPVDQQVVSEETVTEVDVNPYEID